MLQSECNESGMLWKPDLVNLLKKTKPNICKSKSAHFGSNGFYVSFGNKGSYALLDNSSVGQYATKKSKNEAV